jgi:hypothetical protein
LAKTPKILIRIGVLTGKAPSVVPLTNVSTSITIDVRLFEHAKSSR